MVVEGVVKKPTEFPQGTQRIAPITELSEPNLYVVAPPPVQPERSTPAVEAPITDAEVACAVVGDIDAPTAVLRAKRVTSAYTTQAIAIRPILTVT